jgi:hypothetical protein
MTRKPHCKRQEEPQQSLQQRCNRAFIRAEEALLPVLARHLYSQRHIVKETNTILCVAFPHFPDFKPCFGFLIVFEKKKKAD